MSRKILLLFALFFLLCLLHLIGFIEALPSLKNHTDDTQSESPHRHAMNQLEPDLAASIFRQGDVSLNGRNPLSRTTTIPLKSLHLDAGNAEPIAVPTANNMQIHIKSDVNRLRRKRTATSEYERLNSDFQHDDEAVVIEAQHDEVLSDKQVEIPRTDILFSEDGDAESIAAQIDAVRFLFEFSKRSRILN